MLAARLRCCSILVELLLFFDSLVHFELCFRLSTAIFVSPTSSQVFAKEQPAFAAQCLTAAENVYALAKLQSACDVKDGVLLTAAPFAFYPEVKPAV